MEKYSVRTRPLPPFSYVLSLPAPLLSISRNTVSKLTMLIPLGRVAAKLPNIHPAEHEALRIQDQHRKMNTILSNWLLPDTWTITLLIVSIFMTICYVRWLVLRKFVPPQIMIRELAFL